MKTYTDTTELSRAVAEQVMGFRVVPMDEYRDIDDEPENLWADDRGDLRKYMHASWAYWRPATDANQALEVWMKSDIGITQEGRLFLGGWHWSAHDYEYADGTDVPYTFCIAVCIAALCSIGHKCEWRAS